MDKISTNDDSGNSIKSVETGFKIIEYLHDVEVATATEVSNELDLPLSTAHVYLKTLEQIGYVVCESQNYRIGLRFLHHGGVARHKLRIYQIAKHEISDLSEKTQEVANLGVEENGQRVLLQKAEAPEGVYDNPPIGQFTNMHWTALGKAMLSTMSPEQVEKIVSVHGLPKATENTITTLDALIEELDRTRERGYSIEDEERRRRIRAIGIPIEISDGVSSTSAISVSGPRSRIQKKEDEIIDALYNTANVIGLKCNHY